MRWLVVAALLLAGCTNIAQDAPSDGPTDEAQPDAAADPVLETTEILQGEGSTWFTLDNQGAGAAGGRWSSAHPVPTEDGPALYIEVEPHWNGSPLALSLLVFDLTGGEALLLGTYHNVVQEGRTTNGATGWQPHEQDLVTDPFMIRINATDVSPGAPLGFVAISDPPAPVTWHVHMWTQEPPPSQRNSPDPDLVGRMGGPSNVTVPIVGLADAGWVMSAVSMNIKLIVAAALDVTTGAVEMLQTEHVEARPHAERRDVDVASRDEASGWSALNALLAADVGEFEWSIEGTNQGKEIRIQGDRTMVTETMSEVAPVPLLARISGDGTGGHSMNGTFSMTDATATINGLAWVAFGTSEPMATLLGVPSASQEVITNDATGAWEKMGLRLY